MTTPVPDIQWVRLPSAWHVELIKGANRTRCNKAITANAQRSKTAMPTNCNPCRLHWREAVKTAKAEAARAILATPSELPPGHGPKSPRTAIDMVQAMTPKEVAGLCGWRRADVATLVDAPMVAHWLATDPETRHAVSINVAAKLGTPDPIWFETGPLPEVPPDLGEDDHAAILVMWQDVKGRSHCGEAARWGEMNEPDDWFLGFPFDGDIATRASDMSPTGWAWLRGKPEPEGGADA